MMSRWRSSSRARTSGTALTGLTNSLTAYCEAAEERPVECDSQPVPLLEFVAELERVLGREAVKDYRPMQPGDVPRTFADISRARAELDYAPKVKIAEGIERFAEWFRAQPKG